MVELNKMNIPQVDYKILLGADDFPTEEKIKIAKAVGS